MGQKVQGIIIKDNKVLTVKGIASNGWINDFFVSGEVKEHEKPEDAIKRVLKEQINLETGITFRFSKERIPRVTTFLIDMSNKDISVDYNMDEIQCLNSNYKPTDLVWIDLSDEKNRELDIQHHIRLLLQEAIKNNYEAPWMDIIKSNYFNSSIDKGHLNRLYRNKFDSKESLGNKIRGILIALGLGILFDYFFIRDYVGISGLLYSITLIAAFIYGVFRNIKLNKKPSLIFLIPIILLSLSFAIFNNEVLKTLNIILIPFLIASYFITLKYEIKRINLNFVLEVLNRMFIKAIEVTPKFFTFNKELINKRKEMKGSSIRRNIIQGLLISLPLLIIILLLLTSADMVFKYYVEEIADKLSDFNIGRILEHSLIISIVTLYVFGLLWSFRYNDTKEINRNIQFKVSWEPITITTIIFVINIVYLLFTIVQFSYLYGGDSLPQGFTYAEYARKGFFELVTVTIINFTILISSIKFTKKDNTKVNKITYVSYSFLIIFTINMLIAASYKMHIYEKAFGFTRLRIFVQSFMILIGLLQVIVLLGIWIKRIPILKYSVIATLIVYISLNYINVDKIIVKNNINRYEETGKIDVEYIKSLSYDAVTELEKLSHHDDIKIRPHVKKQLMEEKRLLEEEYDHWYEYNYYKSKLLKIVEIEK